MAYRLFDSHYLSQSWIIINRIVRNKLQWNFVQNTKSPFTIMHLKLLSVKWRPFCPGENELKRTSRRSWQHQDDLHTFQHTDLIRNRLPGTNNTWVWRARKRPSVLYHRIPRAYVIVYISLHITMIVICMYYVVVRFSSFGLYSCFKCA